MLRRSLVIGLCALAVACQSPKDKKSGPVIAKGNGVTITADEFKARLDEQSPFIRARYSTLERKKEFLDNLIRFEVLAREAEKQGLATDPDVQMTLKKIMVQKLVQKNFQDLERAKEVPEPELQKYYDEHKPDYFRPKRVRVAAVVFEAPAGSPERAKKLAAAKAALAKIKADEKKNPLAFNQAVAQYSEDAATKNAGGDLQYKSHEELTAAYSKELADAAFALSAGQTSDVVQTPKGLYLLKLTAQQEELNRSFDQVKAQIANKLYREKKTKEFDEWLKRLKDEAKISVDEKALEAVEVSAAAPGAPGMPGTGMTGVMPHGPMPSATPVPPPAK
ncbi:peptidylprolyl isomerase [Anaeromyxobacter terrae]|uniref:peptidylprolyl isomerase n=1 Tax=Anaeromyxobacter terrae TaxID=2925406 RepID=UPI001F5A70E6|nr:peptidyl-prolyl cis-trans isomerase [Anaeromyxobacter sp. SG22]